MIGPGQYDELAKWVQEQTGAAGAVVIVISGEQGQEFAVRGKAPVLAALPGMLRLMADKIEADLHQHKATMQ